MGLKTLVRVSALAACLAGPGALQAQDRLRESVVPWLRFRVRAYLPEPSR